MNSDLIKQESLKYLKELDAGLVPDYLKKDYFEYEKHHIIMVLLSLTKDFKDLTTDDVFDYLEPLEENRCLFEENIFQRIAENTNFFEKQYWNEIIELHHSAYNLIRPGWWDEIRQGSNNWINIMKISNQLIDKLHIKKIDSIDYSERYIDDEILIKITKAKR